jgi:hypothetical protein
MERSRSPLVRLALNARMHRSEALLYGLLLAVGAGAVAYGLVHSVKLLSGWSGFVTYVSQLLG